MVSINFDEFHAIRSRQRAAAEAADSSKRKNDAAGDATSSAKAPSHTDSDDHGGRSSVTGRRRDLSSKLSSNEGSGAGEEVAPTSGSASKVQCDFYGIVVFFSFCIFSFLVWILFLRSSCWCVPTYWWYDINISTL